MPKYEHVQKIRWMYVALVPILSLALILFLALGLDRDSLSKFFRDDSFFYIKVAHNWGAGLGPTFDGFAMTNGFHYLWMALLVLLDRIVALQGVPGLRAVMILHGILVAAAAYPAGRFFEKLGLTTSWLLLLIELLMSMAMFANIGIESPILLLLSWAFVVCLYEQQGAFEAGVTSAWRSVAVGVSALGVVAARSDAVVWTAACGASVAAYQWFRHRNKHRAMTTIIWIFGPSLAFLAVAAVSNLIFFGHSESISAYIKNDFPDFLHNGWFQRAVIGIKVRLLLPVIISLISLWLFFPARSLFSSIGGQRSPVAYWILAGLNMYVVIYSTLVYFFALGGINSWYFTLSLSVACTNIICVAQYLMEKLNFSTWLKGFVIVATIGLIPTFTSLSLYLERFPKSETQELLVMADWMRSNLPQETRVFMVDLSGTMGYFSERGVVNGDGLINSWEYLDALRHGRLVEYLTQHNVKYVVAHQSPKGKMVSVWLGVFNLAPGSFLLAPVDTIMFSSGPFSIAPLSAYRLSVDGK